MHVPYLPDAAVEHTSSRFLHLRIEADVEIRAVHEPALLGQRDELAGLGGGQRERLLADDVLAGLEGALHLRVVEVVRRGEVDDVHAFVCKQRLVALIRWRQPLCSRALRARPDDACHLDAETP